MLRMYPFLAGGGSALTRVTRVAVPGFTRKKAEQPGTKIPATIRDRSFPGQFNSWTINCKVLKTISSTVRERIQIQTRRPCYTGCRGYKEAPAGWRPPVIGQRSTPSVKSHLSIYQWRLYSATLWGFIPPADVQSFQARRTQKRSDAREFVTGQPASGPKSAAHRTTAGVNPTLLFDCAVTVCSASFSQLAIRLA